MVKNLKFLAAACVAAWVAAPAVAADNYPSKPITIILPYATGGSADMLARFAAQALQSELGQPAIVAAQPAAGAVLGTELVARADPARYTLVLNPSGPMGVNQYVPKLSHKPLAEFK